MPTEKMLKIPVQVKRDEPREVDVAELSKGKKRWHWKAKGTAAGTMLRTDAVTYFPRFLCYCVLTS